MGTKHSVPVTSTQSEGPTMPYSSFASSMPRSGSGRHNHNSGSGALAPHGDHHGKLSTTAIRSHEAACMSPLDIK